ncbi:MAG: hypothetical protein HN712_04670 [Gemmatimonadetes bacterium]|nr:hypothetical protein [Gemmatimonadota bacterium]MBT6144241.1 hypothetical protein [Gemmatimonadota bacterium]MBT7859579.1 hypothetical protein [Gemmatimonadota bacterium]
MLTAIMVFFVLLKVALIAAVAAFGWLLYRKLDLKGGLWTAAFMGLSMITGLLSPQIHMTVVNALNDPPRWQLPFGFESFGTAMATLNYVSVLPGLLAGLAIALLVIGDGVRVLDRLEIPIELSIFRWLEKMSSPAITWGIASMCLLLAGPIGMYFLGLYLEGLVGPTNRVGPPW